MSVDPSNSTVQDFEERRKGRDFGDRLELPGDDPLNASESKDKLKLCCGCFWHLCVSPCVVVLSLVIFTILGITLPSTFAKDGDQSWSSADRSIWVATMLLLTFPVLALIHQFSKRCFRIVIPLRNFLAGLRSAPVVSGNHENESSGLSKLEIDQKDACVGRDSHDVLVVNLTDPENL